MIHVPRNIRTLSPSTLSSKTTTNRDPTQSLSGHCNSTESSLQQRNLWPAAVHPTLSVFPMYQHQQLLQTQHVYTGGTRHCCNYVLTDTSTSPPWSLHSKSCTSTKNQVHSRRLPVYTWQLNASMRRSSPSKRHHPSAGKQ